MNCKSSRLAILYLCNHMLIFYIRWGLRCRSSSVKVGLEVTLAATTTRTGANLAMMVIESKCCGLKFHHLSTCVLTTFKNYLVFLMCRTLS